jgi:tRNA U54 and U55 pseudouridine synthase Pus10
MSTNRYTVRVDERATQTERKTPTVGVRVPRPMWEAYERICARLGRDRTEDITDHIRRRIREHGDERDVADLDAAELELAERRSRKGGRPPKSV